MTQNSPKCLIAKMKKKMQETQWWISIGVHKKDAVRIVQYLFSPVFLEQLFIWLILFLAWQSDECSFNNICRSSETLVYDAYTEKEK